MADDFLSRWSRRKRGIAEADGPPAPAPDRPPPDAACLDALAPRGASPEEADPSADPSDRMSEEEIAALPPLDALNETSDLGPFLRAGVPGVLRNAALRRMWSLDPSIRDFVSEAREYAYDWNCPGGVPGLGPLLPGDDVTAMVRRVFEGRREQPGPEVETAADPSEARPRVEPAPIDQAADLPTDLSADFPADSLPDLTAALPAPSAGPGDPLARIARAAERAPARTGRPARTEPPGRPRLRRHGGALPG